MGHWTDRLIAAAIFLLAPIAVLAARFIWDPALPPALPTHWDAAGQVDGTTGQAAFFWVCLIVSGGLAVGGIAAAANRQVTRSWVLVGVMAFCSWLLTAGYVMVLAAAQGASRPEQVHLPWQMGIALLVVGIAAAVAVMVLLPRDDRHPLPRDDPHPKVSAPAATPVLPAHEGATWVGTARSRLLAVVAVVLAAAAVGAAFTSWPLAIALLLGAVAMAWLHIVTVRIDYRGVHTLWGPTRWPRSTVPLGVITAATAEEINPAQWGGWGYRIGPRGRGAIVRKGRGLVLERDGQPRYAVTVDHADDAADAVNALLARRGDSRP